MDGPVAVQITVLEAKFISKLKNLRCLTHSIELSNDEDRWSTPPVKFYKSIEFTLNDRYEFFFVQLCLSTA